MRFDRLGSRSRGLFRTCQWGRTPRTVPPHQFWRAGSEPGKGQPRTLEEGSALRELRLKGGRQTQGGYHEESEEAGARVRSHRERVPWKSSRDKLDLCFAARGCSLIFSTCEAPTSSRPMISPVPGVVDKSVYRWLSERRKLVAFALYAAADGRGLRDRLLGSLRAAVARRARGHHRRHFAPTDRDPTAQPRTLRLGHRPLGGMRGCPTCSGYLVPGSPAPSCFGRRCC